MTVVRMSLMDVYETVKEREENLHYDDDGFEFDPEVYYRMREECYGR